MVVTNAQEASNGTTKPMQPGSFSAALNMAMPVAGIGIIQRLAVILRSVSTTYWSNFCKCGGAMPWLPSIKPRASNISPDKLVVGGHLPVVAYSDEPQLGALGSCIVCWYMRQ